MVGAIDFLKMLFYNALVLNQIKFNMLIKILHHIYVLREIRRFFPLFPV